MKHFLSPMLALLLASLPAFASDGIRAQTVHFAKGASSQTLKGSLTGHGVNDYVLGAAAGQTLRVDLKGGATTYFNVMAQGNDTALYNGSMDGNNATLKLPANGNYVVRVYQMGNAKDAGKTTAYTLTVAITGKP